MRLRFCLAQFFFQVINNVINNHLDLNYNALNQSKSVSSEDSSDYSYSTMNTKSTGKILENNTQENIFFMYYTIATVI